MVNPCNLLRPSRLRWAAGLCLAVLFVTGIGQAQLPIPASTQFDITGFLQEATLDPTCTASAHCGGTLKVNNHVVTVPKETIVIFPANAVTWQELFTKAPAPWGIGTIPPTTGMAAADCANATVPCTAPPLTTYEVHVVGNRVLGGQAGADAYVAGLIYISQQSLNSGAGFINFIDYTLGEMRVGGIIGDPNCAQGGTSVTNPFCSGARVRLNDPVGRYGRATTSPDVRFTVDPDNPTIMAGTGYPMCLPRSAPLGGTPDTLCPEGNRPRDILGNPASSITTANLTSTCGGTCVPQPAGSLPDSTLEAPFEIGDYVTFQGTLVKDAPAGGFVAGDGPTVGPMPTSGSTYIAAHTIVNNVAIFTFPGSDPAYVETDVFILGTGGLTVLGAGEAAIRTRFEGMMTDPSRFVHLYGMDLNVTGTEADRDWGTIGVDPGPPTGAVKGRWRFRPPCLAFGSVPTKPDKQCVMNAAGTFLPPTREVRAVIYDPATGVVSNPGNAGLSANGLIYGQYHAPILEYIFPENIPGTPIVENNFNAMPFLACGGYSSSGIGIPPTTPVLAGVLNPWPSNVLPLGSACAGFVAPPTAVSATATPSSVISGTAATVTLSATASGSAPLTFQWTQAATDTVQVALTNAGTATATFTTPVVTTNTTLNFTVTVSNSAGSASAAVSVTIAVDQPVVNHVAPQTVFSGTPVTMSITGVDPGGLPLTFTVTQTGGPAPNIAPLSVTQNPPSGATATFTESLAVGAPGVTLSFTIVATNTAGVSSAPEFTTVTVNPQPDAITITSAEYRIGKQRLIINASSSVISPAVVFTLQPYLTEAGTTYNPDPAAGGVGNLFTNNGAGLYLIDLVGAPRPACNLGGTYATPCTQRPIIVTSTLGGTSGPTALSRIRQ